MKTYPAKPEHMRRRMERMQHLDVAARIAPILVLECKLVLDAYYGSYRKAAFALLREWAYFQTHDRYWRGVLWLTDKVGWTKLVPIPGAPGAAWRHGGKCEYLNCGDRNCIGKSLPKWFKFVTRWEDY